MGCCQYGSIGESVSRRVFIKIGNKKLIRTISVMLIVVAIIGVLVAISIPIFTSQLEKAREATDMANIRSAYAECSAAAVTEDDWTNHPKEDNTFKNYTYTAATETAPAQWSITVTATQKSTSNGTEGWANGKPNIGGTSVAAKTDSYTVTVKADGTCEIK